MIDAMKYWVTTFDVDGFRCDYAAGVPTDFWNDATSQLRAVKSSLWFLAEDQGEKDKLTSAFDSDYGWAFKDVLYKLGNGSGTAWDFLAEEENQSFAYSQRGTFPMLFITNHDENSWTGSLTGLFGSGAKTLAALTFTAPGIPLIYDGQEVDSNRQLQFFEKDQIDWNFDSARSKTAVAFYTKLIKLKHKNSALNANLSRSSFKPFSVASDWVTAFKRSNGANKVYVVMNLSKKARTATVKWGTDKAYYYRYSDGKRMKLPASQKYSLKPWQFEIYSTVKP
jgi:glycosidase